MEFATKTVTLSNGEKVKAQLWDTAGQERYRSITRAHYRKAVGALVVYDITKEATYTNIPKWIQELKEQAEPDLAIMIVGNKLDLAEESRQRAVNKDEAKAFAERNGCLFEETSALANVNVTNTFEVLLESKFLTHRISI